MRAVASSGAVLRPVTGMCPLLEPLLPPELAVVVGPPDATPATVSVV